jgi:hypothetical protein
MYYLAKIRLPQKETPYFALLVESFSNNVRLLSILETGTLESLAEIALQNLWISRFTDVAKLQLTSSEKGLAVPIETQEYDYFVRCMEYAFARAHPIQTV